MECNERGGPYTCDENQVNTVSGRYGEPDVMAKLYIAKFSSLWRSERYGEITNFLWNVGNGRYGKPDVMAKSNSIHLQYLDVMA